MIPYLLPKAIQSLSCELGSTLIAAIHPRGESIFALHGPASREAIVNGEHGPTVPPGGIRLSGPASSEKVRRPFGRLFPTFRPPDRHCHDCVISHLDPRGSRRPVSDQNSAAPCFTGISSLATASRSPDTADQFLDLGKRGVVLLVRDDLDTSVTTSSGTLSWNHRVGAGQCRSSPVVLVPLIGARRDLDQAVERHWRRSSGYSAVRGIADGWHGDNLGNRWYGEGDAGAEGVMLYWPIGHGGPAGRSRGSASRESCRPVPANIEI